jgi:DNA invertase Pin-like site-specific DNA recombinase
VKFVSYYRVSTTKQELGLEAQREAVGRYLSTVQGEVIAEYAEKLSGADNARPALAEAIRASKQHKARLVISTLSRLSRNAAFLLYLRDSQVDFVAADMPSADSFTVGIMALLAQKERELISERTKAALAVLKTKGVKLGNPDGTTARQKALQVVKEQKEAFAAKAIVSIQEIQSTGVTSLKRIADYLNKRGEKTARGKTWNGTAVRRVVGTASLFAK